MYSVSIIDNDVNVEIISGDFYYGTPDNNVYNKDELYCAVGTSQIIYIRLTLDNSIVYTISTSDDLYINNNAILGLNTNQLASIINEVLESKPISISNNVVYYVLTPTNPTLFVLPDATTVNNIVYTIKKIDTNTNLLNIVTVLGQTIDDEPSFSLKYKSSLSLISNGFNWIII